MKTHKKKGLPETELQKGVVAHFRRMEELGTGFTFFSVVGGSVRVPIHIGKRLKDSGCRAGVSDLVFILHGNKAVFIELKTATGHLTPAQKEWDSKLKGLGVSSYCVKGATVGEIVSQINIILKNEGVENG